MCLLLSVTCSLFRQTLDSLSKFHRTESKLRKGIERNRRLIEDSLARCQGSSPLTFNLAPAVTASAKDPAADNSENNFDVGNVLTTSDKKFRKDLTQAMSELFEFCFRGR